MGPGIDNQEQVSQPGATSSSSVLDTPFNGPMQPEGSVAAPVTAAIDQGAILDEMPLDLQDDPPPPRARANSRQRFVGLGLVGFGLVAALAFGIRIELNKSKSLPVDSSQKVKTQSVPLSRLSSQLGSSPALNTLTVNGDLAVSSSISLLPTAKPANATMGELYYDQTTNQLGYYNGSGFVYLQGGASAPIINNYTTNQVTNNVTNVTNIAGSNGTISGSGTTGYIALFSSANTIGSSILSQNTSGVTVAGTAQLKSTTNSVAAFQVQNATGSSLLTADTSNNAVVLGNDGNLSAVTLRGGQAVGSNVTGTNLTIVGANGTGSANGGDIILETGQTPQGGIQLDATATAAQKGATVSLNYTTSTQRSRLLIATTDWLPTVFTYDGKPLTLLGSVVSTQHFGGGVHIYMWYLVNPPSGTFTLSANNGSNGSTIGVASYYNVSQTAPFGTVVSNSGNLSGTQSSSLSVATSNSSQIVVDAFGVDATSGNCTPTSGQTVRWSIVQSFFPVACGSDIVATGGTVTVSWSMTNSDWADLAVPINPAVPGSVPLQFPTPTTPDALYDRLHITATGNVGIDNSNPQYALDVNGIINSSAGIYSSILDTATSTALSIGNLDASSIQLGNPASNITTAIVGTAVIKPTPNNDSATDFQIQNAAGTVLFNANTTNMTITISGTSSAFGTLALSNAHITSTQTTAPTISTPLNCGTGATATVTAGSTDTTGSYTINVGSGSPTTCDVTLTFKGVYGAVPNTVLTPAGTIGGATAPMPAWVSNSSSASFTAQIAPTNATAGAVYSYYYWTAQ